MLGLSPLKILVTIAIIAAIWYGFKVLGNAQEARGRAGGAKPSSAKRPQAKPDAGPDGADVEEMVACKVCGDFVSSARPKSCGRDDCPYT